MKLSQRIGDYFQSEQATPLLRSAILLVTVTAITSVMTFFVTDYLEPSAFRAGEVARHTIIARNSFSVEDTSATEHRRDDARQAVPRVMIFDDRAENSPAARIDRLFSAIRERSTTSDSGKALVLDEAKRKEIEGQFGVDFLVQEWDALLHPEDWQAIRNEVVRLADPLWRKGVVAIREIPGFDPDIHRIAVRRIHGSRESIETDESLTDEQEAMADLNGHFPEKGYGRGENFDRVVLELSRACIRPNVRFNEAETHAREEAASKLVQAVSYTVRRGEVVVRAGDVINHTAEQKIQAMLHLQGQSNFFRTWTSYSILGTMIIFCLFIFTERYWPGFNPSNRDLSVMALTLMGSIFLLKFFFGLTTSLSYGFFDIDSKAFILVAPLAAGGMLLETILGPATVFLFVVSFALLVGIFLADSWLIVSLIVVGNIVGAICLKSCRRRSSFLVAGTRVAGANVILVACLAMLYPEIGRQEIVNEVLCVIAGGILSGLLALGLTPVAELIGGYVTDFKLLELASLDRPLLNELSLQAPGTWNHSMVLGQMGEVAAEAIGVNGLLTRVGAYYHDIGKMRKPLYFVENQMGKDNRHDKLTPSMSALIIKSHVKDGVELAREHSLPQALIDFILQHHGMALIEYFYDKAVKEAEEGEVVDETHYRYPGPRPQTKEAGILMLADIIEASSRTLPDPTPAKIQGLVQKAINKVFASGELNDSTLTLNDLNKIAKSFTRVLSGIYHRRIEYSESLEKGKEHKAKDDEKAESKSEEKRADSASTSEAGGEKATDTASSSKAGEGDSPETLKRLGLQ